MEIPVLQPSETQVGLRLDAFIAAHFGVSRSRAVKIIENVTLNGRPAKPKNTLHLGDTIEGADPALALEIEPEKYAAPLGEMPQILFEDDDLMVIRKPRGVTVHAGNGDTGITLVEILQSHGRVLSSVGPPERAGIVHRLDKDTSGAMIVCKTDAAHWKLAADFEARRITKTYQAIVNGIPSEKGRIEAPIARSLSNRTKMTISPSGRFATTEYEVERSWERFALLKINLLTGRTHQIRVHFAYINFPIAGDVVYSGYHRAVNNAPDDHSKLALEELKGQALHAAKIEFEHPITGQKMSFEAPAPPEIQRIITAFDQAKANADAIEALPKPRHFPFGHE
ncbi:ribosomal large subunit pseudouridine synthase D [Abditibacterium utsteinense]|uniref:Pseudouridine synthase n=1 Tax=Abditibacterium utsteinense TaxID=1960156 RepID=A0A2S8SWA0_9BACT|nr:RluA family pseudouridine synthase [Abditibacterium utsteinense]PQV65073.1 ribosomal large subunit pseudouridine synthase D [Abditibacterium utsteinense]